MCFSEEMWKFLNRRKREGDMWLALKALSECQIKGSSIEISEAIGHRQIAMRACEIVLRYPHTYDLLVRLGYVSMFVREICEADDLSDQMSVFSSVTNRITNR